MVSDIDQLISALHRDPPEQVLKDEIRKRRGEILDLLKQGKSYEMKDFRGRTIRISPKATLVPETFPEKQPA
ncbi:hypothetical protein ACPOL_2138 [Acidisarcina polymorpha]|uniref:Uncharacterized protein n=1 Tax=Acidisarcina polymorpha TaxID=2211140 RepID=A0A2Z5FXE9_9BACT|nr:hypothetical protein [Acidisarcina polymorpha]AXC11462.1 hypothetical protein ACPOL_2138 [Acidisarcina polymorpha]